MQTINRFTVRWAALFILLLTINGGKLMAIEEANYSVIKQSGDNETNDEIAMTSPVSQRKASEKIARTAPVSQQSSDDGWMVSFMMPASYTMSTIPKPTNPDVRIREIPAFRAATIRFSGRWTEKNYREHLGELQAWIEQNELTITGEPIWARYDPPFKPWFMRRNEILIPVS